VIDLTSAPSDANPTLKTLRSFGAVPSGIVLSPPMIVPDTADASLRTFAFVLADNVLTVFDTAHPTRREASIRLDLGGAAVVPRQIVFAPTSSSAYVRSDNARDVLQVLIVPDLQVGDSADFRPQLAELGAGGGPTDFAVYDDATGRRTLLAATPNTSEIVVIDAETAQFRAVPISDPVDRILLFADTPGGVPTTAVLASVGAKLPRLGELDLSHITDPLVQPTVTPIVLDQPVRDVVAVPGRELAMVVHDDARTVLGVLDVATQSTSPLLGVGRLDSYDFTPNGSHLLATTASVAAVGFVELDDLHPTALRLDDLPTRVLAVENGKIFVDHGAPLGRATVIPSPTATRAQAIVLDGFLTTDLLDQGL